MFSWQGFGSGGAAGVVSVRSHCPRQIRARSSCSRWDWFLPEQSHEQCRVCSGSVDFRKGKTAALQQLGESSEKCERNSAVSAEGGQEVLQVQSRSSLQPRRGPWQSRLSSCSPQVPGGADLHIQPTGQQQMRP